VDNRRGSWADMAISDLVSEAAGGNGRAWAELHRRYHRMITGVARSAGCASADLCDVQQAVWARLFRHIHRLRQPEAIGGWLAVVTKRECLRLIGRGPAITDIDELASVAATGDEPLASVLENERRAAVRNAVATLSPRRRTLIETMLDHPDLDYGQLADRLSMPVGSIGPTRQRGLDELRRRRELVEWRPAAHSTVSAQSA
jgi:RNA polymerase sigma factor (sigma-70 family)